MASSSADSAARLLVTVFAGMASVTLRGAMKIQLKHWDKRG